MSTKNESKLNNHIRLFKKVLAISKKKMSLAEKVMFCYIISYVITGQVFDLENKHLAARLGDTIQSITDYITRLETMGLVKIEYDRVPPSEGGYYITKRFITVINLAEWTDKATKAPDVPLVPKKNSKKKTPVEKTPVMPVAKVDEQAEVMPEPKPIEVKPEPAPEIKPLQPKETGFNVHEYLTPAKLDYFKRFENDTIKTELLYNLTKVELDSIFYCDNNTWKIKTVENDKEDLWENMNGVNLHYIGAGSRLSLFVNDKDGKQDRFQLNEKEFYTYLEKNNKNFGNLTVDNFDTLKQHKVKELTLG